MKQISKSTSISIQDHVRDIKSRLMVPHTIINKAIDGCPKDATCDMLDYQLYYSNPAYTRLIDSALAFRKITE